LNIKDSSFNSLKIGKLGSVILSGGSNIFSNPYTFYIKNPIINNGRLKFTNSIYGIKAVTSSYVENHGIIEGSLSFGFSDKREFKYIISENEELTDEEKGELENSN
jgi:hypothetical protein